MLVNYLGYFALTWMLLEYLILPLVWPPLQQVKTYVCQVSEFPSETLFRTQDLIADENATTLVITIDNFNLEPELSLYPIHPYREISRSFFEAWLEEQVDISIDKVLSNIGDVNWSDALIQQNVSEGAVIASPSKVHPDYFYQWVRDGAITINSVTNFLSDVDYFQNKSMQMTIENYLSNSYNLQRTDNPSGSFDDKLKSLGEPKFLVDSSPFELNWGRPQNDGPPLRVIAIDNFLKSMKKFNADLIKKDDNLKDERDIYEKIIKLDLKFIILHWKDANFDLWEEIHSHHFFTSLTQLKALKIGMKLFNQFDDQDQKFGKRLKQTYSQLHEFMFNESGFTNTHGLNHIVETPSIIDRRSGLDAATIIGALLTHDDDDDVVPFDVNDGYILNSLSEMVKSMRYLFPINHERLNLNLGVALGRYPEDEYDGTSVTEGNPWFLCTLAASELMFKIIDKFYEGGQDLIIDRKNQHFFFSHIIEMTEFVPYMGFTQGNYNDLELHIPYNSLAFNQTMMNIFQYGESFMDVVREHVGNDGSMSEQFNRYSGYMQGAEDLTWSYGSFWSTYRWRKRALTFVDEQ